MLESSMRRLASFLIVFLAAAAFGSRDRIRFDADWRFKLEPHAPTALNEAPEWQWYAVADKPLESATAPPPPPIQAPVRIAHAGEDVFHGRRGYAWFATTLRHTPTGTKGRVVLHFESVDDNATVYINGHRVLYHEGWNEPFDVPLDSVQDGQAFTVQVLVQNTDGPGGIGAVSFQTVESPENQPREAQSGFFDKTWRTVHLPHDFVIEGAFSPNEDAGHGSLPKGSAWYRKTFALPRTAKGKSVWLDFDGAFSDAHVWLNGVYLGSHRSGYTGFRFDIAKYAKPGGTNVVAVHVDSRKTEGWWYEGGGLYRHVWLTITDPIHITPLGGVYVTSKVSHATSSRPAADVTAWVQVDNTLPKTESCTLKTILVDPDGRSRAVAIRKLRLLGKQTGVTAARFHDSDARLWSLEKPRLYALRTEVIRNGHVVDSVDTPFGIRTIRFDPNRGFLLNDRPVKLKGTCNHQDFAGVGIGMPDSVLAWRIKKLKGMGSNAYRCSHNEVASELLDACDRLGMLVMDENREFGDTYAGKANEGTTANDLSDLRQEIYRDRNHPSVILWSICNEEFGVQSTPAGGRIGKAMVDTVHGIDPTRPVTAALNGGHGSYLSDVLDVEGFNYGPAGYPRYHRAHPNHPMFASETASTTTDRGIYSVDKQRGYVPAYDTGGSDTAEAAWEPIAREPYNAGGFVWTGFDYKGEPTPYGWPCVNSHFGILDMCGFPKDNYYYYKAWWGDAPLVHIEPHWNWAGKEGQPIDVWTFANGDEVELSLNGRSLGRKPNPAYEHQSWHVPYEPGRLVAKTYRGGRLIASDAVETTTAPAALRVTTDRTHLSGDDEDTTMLEVSVVDSKGRVVPTADNLIRFTLTGPAWVSGVGNGDPSCHEPDRASRRHAFNGRALGLIQAKTGQGKVVVTISSAGLKPARIVLEVTPGRDQ